MDLAQAASEKANLGRLPPAAPSAPAQSAKISSRVSAFSTLTWAGKHGLVNMGRQTAARQIS
jgi:hypothetical protein